MAKSTNFFWITNISKMDVSLSDLNITVPALSSINLLDDKHYQFTEEQLKKSALNGSIHLKSDKIYVRKTAPTIHRRNLPVVDENAIVPSRRRSAVVLKNENYEELLISDEKFAMENAEISDEVLKQPKEIR